MMVLRLLFFLALLLCVECLCMATAGSPTEPQDGSTCRGGDSGCPDASGHAANSCEDGSSGSGCPAGAGGVEASGGGDCSHGSTCNSNSSIRNSAREDCVEPSGPDSCPTDVDETQENCPSGGSGCKNKSQEENHASLNENSGINGGGRQGHDGQSRPLTDQGSHTEGRQEDRANVTVDVLPPGEPETRETQSVNGSQGGASSPAGGTGGAPTAAGQTESSVVSATEEGGSKQGSETAQPSSSYSNNSATGSDVGSDAVTPENGTSSAESESPSNRNDGGNADTTTTTTTTTLSPETTNNKKGDADSSSSMSSSVWVRVPLLIVVTLACILLC